VNRSHGAYALLICAVCAAYFNALWGDFQFDDYNVIVQNPVVHSWAAWWSEVPHGIRPLLKATYTLNWILGPDAFGFHLLNVLVHAGNTLLVYALTTALLRELEARGARLWASGERDTLTPALLAALLFAVHPVQTEAVTYISGRSVSLMALLYLGSVLAYVRGRAADETRQRWLLYGLSPGLFVLALLVKEVAVTLPAALLLWEMLRGAGRPSWSVILRRQALHWTVLAAAVVVLFRHPGYYPLLAFSFSVRSLQDAVLTQIHGIVYLLSRLVWVHHLNIDPDLPVISRWTPALAAEGLFLATCLGVGVISLRRHPWVGFGILWVFLHLLPTNSVVPRLDVANERQLYLAGWGGFLLIGAALAQLLRATLRPQIVSALSVLIVVGLGAATVLRNEAYRTEVALWEATVRESPAKARAYNNLGYAYALAGRPGEAEEAFGTALRLDPEFALARQNLSSVRSK